MAITKTIFTGTLTEQREVIYNWLKANASEYFDSIEYAGSQYATYCYINGVKVLEINHNLSSIIVTLLNGSSINKNIYYGAGFNIGVVTDYGVIIGNTATDRNTWLFITKSDSGNTCIIVNASDSGQTAYSLIYADVSGNTINTLFTGNGTNNELRNKITRQAGLTALMPFVSLDYQSYTPNLFMLTYSDVYGMQGNIAMNNVEYYSNGCIALRG